MRFSLIVFAMLRWFCLSRSFLITPLRNHAVSSKLLIKVATRPIRSSCLASNKLDDKPEKNAFEQVASKGAAGILAIAVAESIFWALGVPTAQLWYKISTGDWIDLSTSDGQLKAAGFSFGYGGFATIILQYRVTLFAIPLVPIMERYVVNPAKSLFGRPVE